MGEGLVFSSSEALFFFGPSELFLDSWYVHSFHLCLDTPLLNLFFKNVLFKKKKKSIPLLAIFEKAKRQHR